MVFRLSLSLPRKIVMITFMHCKVVVMINVGWSVVGLGLACGLVLRIGLVLGLYKWLFYLATVRQLNNVVNISVTLFSFGKLIINLSSSVS